MESNLQAQSIGEAGKMEKGRLAASTLSALASDDDIKEEEVDFVSLLAGDIATQEQSPSSFRTISIPEGTDELLEEVKASAVQNQETEGADKTNPLLKIEISKSGVTSTSRNILPQIQADSGEGIRRQKMGFCVLDETFPPGWEVLLEDEGPLESKVELNGEPSQRLPKTLPAVKFAETDSLLSERVKTSTEYSEQKPVSEGLVVLKNRPSQSSEQTFSTKTAQISMEAIIEKHTESADISSGKEDLSESSQEITSSSVRETQMLTETRIASHPTKAVFPTPAQTLAKLSELQKQMVVRDFVQTTSQGISARKDQVSVELHPPELGRIKVVVESRGEHIHAHLTIQDHSVGEFFQDRLDVIRRSLEEAGIRLGNLSVEIKQQFNLGPQDETPGQYGSAARNGSGQTDTGRLSTRSSAGRQRAAHSGKVDMLI